MSTPTLNHLDELPYPEFFQNYSEAIFITDSQQQLIYSNPAFVQMSGANAASIVHEVLASMIEKEENVRVSMRNPQLYNLVVSRTKIQLKNEMLGYVFVLSEVIEESDLKQELDKKTKETTRAKEELEQILYVVSHDLQAPLRSTGSFIQLMEKSIKKGDTQAVGEFMKFVLEGVATMQSLIQDLLEFSRITTKGQPFVETDLNQVLQSAQIHLMKKIEEKGAVITSQQLPKVKGDTAQLTRLFQELLDNALKFVPSDRKPEINISVKERETDYLISLGDNGIGIEEKFYSRIFVIFQRLHQKGDYEGTGIGLAVGKRILERHGGEIWVESEVGKGSVFNFTLNK
ncbi:MAG: GHKL domain-containing protein [Bacteroidetes bacterium]|nr:GHKL domain-containing protein [Bacteroidota bacterium]